MSGTIFWAEMNKELSKWIAQCQRCISAKAPYLQQCAQLINTITSQPMKMVALDFFGVGGHGGDTNVLVITDNFSKYAVAVPTNNQKT